MDNLQSTTYETFERDPVKYAQYEEARKIFLSLHFLSASEPLLPLSDTTGRLSRNSGPFVNESFVRQLCNVQNPSMIVAILPR